MASFQVRAISVGRAKCKPAPADPLGKSMGAADLVRNLKILEVELSKTYAFICGAVEQSPLGSCCFWSKNVFDFDF